MSINLKLNQRTALAVLLVAVAPLASAATWTASSSCTSNLSTVGYGNTVSCTGTDLTAVSIKAWATTGATSTIEDAKALVYSGGIGVTNRNLTDGPDSGSAADETQQPQHTVDNVTNTDMVLLDFGTSKVTLTGLSIGWWYGTSDTDISVLRYKGGSAPAMTGKTIAELLTAGWELVDNGTTSGVGSSQFNVAGGATYSNGAVASDAFNKSGASSSWWLVSAYNSGFGGTGSTTSDAGGSDYFKLLSVSGTVGGQTPEPGTLALLGVAGLGFFGVRRRKQA